LRVEIQVKGREAPNYPASSTKPVPIQNYPIAQKVAQVVQSYQDEMTVVRVLQGQWKRLRIT